MHLVPPRLLGIVVMALLCALGVVMLGSPGSLRLERPRGGWAAWAYNVVNLLVILAVTPGVGLCLLRGAERPLAATGIALGDGAFVKVLEGIGLGLFVGGYGLMCHCRRAMRRSFRLGGVPPRDEDRLVTSGPYRLVRHPMYAAVLAGALGLALLVQSLAIMALFVVLLGLVLLLLPIEERQLARAYGDEYERYCRRVKRLVPFVY
jgi:protein-S-isoprenylcysteine O-methyltransferase Ste14